MANGFVRDFAASPLRIDILAAVSCRGAILYGLYDLLQSVGSAWSYLTEGTPTPPMTRVRIVAAEPGPFRCIGGVPVMPDATLETADDAEIVVLPNFREGPEADYRTVQARELAWLMRRYEAGAHLAAACSGAQLIVELGLLDGETATAHWSCRETFRLRYPRVDFRPERTLTFAGEGDRIVTAGGMAGWSDLALYLIARFLGPEHAFHAARFYCVDPRVEGQSRYAAMSRRVQSDDAVIRDCQLWVAEGYATTDPVAAMLARSGLPRRSFDRRFRAATGYSPREYVQALRIEEAKQLLEATREPVEAVAQMVGYSDARAFQRLFRRATDLTPSAYRRRFSYDRFLMER
jgi:transcriptional regulator GlxA family with amidase domain